MKRYMTQFSDQTLHDMFSNKAISKKLFDTIIREQDKHGRPLCEIAKNHGVKEEDMLYQFATTHNLMFVAKIDPQLINIGVANIIPFNTSAYYNCSWKMPIGRYFISQQRMCRSSTQQQYACGCYC